LKLYTLALSEKNGYMKQKVQFTETVLRDANQSLIATRLPYNKFESILSTLDAAGYYSLECWGGATFDVCLRYLNEDPWERLRKIKSACPNTKLQMLLRGQNILGYKPYPDDVVRKFVERSVTNGIDIIRIFDALNDVRNLEVAIDETLKQGAIASGTISYTNSPVHTIEKFVQQAKNMAGLGVQTICIKDMAGIMGPDDAYRLVSAIKNAVNLPIVVHTHSTTGYAFMTLLKAVEAGADIIDTAISPFSGGTSQPATETMYYALRQLGYNLPLAEEKLEEIANYFKPMRDEYVASGAMMSKSMVTDPQYLRYQIPGGMQSNLLSQLQMMDALDRLDEVLAEVPKVRADMGYPPLVTPTSQIIGTQAVMNVLNRGRYVKVTKETKAYCRGEYGRTPAPIDKAVRTQILGDKRPIMGRYADSLEPAFEKVKDDTKDFAQSDEDVLSYIAFPQLAEPFIRARNETEGWTLNNLEQDKIKAEVADKPVPYELEAGRNYSSGELLLQHVSDDDVVMIMAIMADCLHRPLGHLHFKSIIGMTTERTV